MNLHERLQGLDIEFRPIQREDEAFLYDVYASTREEELSQVAWDVEQKHSFLIMQFQAQHMYYQEHYRGDEFLVILQKGEPIGRLYVGRWEREYRVIDIALLPAFRNRGIGSRILRSLMDEAAEAGKIVSIHVEKFNPAYRLYERLGFIKKQDKGVYDLLEWKAGPESSS